MRTKKFFASAAKAAFALAAAMMMSTAFTSCSKDNDDKPEPKFTNTVTIDGVEKPIVKAEYKDMLNGNYALYLYLSADGKERVRFELNKDLHMSGSPVDLTKRGKGQGFECYWMVEYYKSDGTQLIDSYGAPGEDDYHRNAYRERLVRRHHQHQTRKRPREGQRRQGTHPHHQLQRQDNGVVNARAALDRQD